MYKIIIPLKESSENTVHHHFVIFKPFGFLSQFVNNEQRQGKMKLLGELHDFPKGTMAIGRLDKQSEGLLLLTTDGKFSELVRSNHIEKEYYAQVDGIISKEAINRLSKGVTISVDGDNYLTKPSKVHILETLPILPIRAKKIRDERHGPTSWVSITLKEGKFRQVRKMTAAVGFPTLRLVRVRIGNITINEMAAGDVLTITTEAL